jgi:DNA mismatch endonuclease (patch repair protein)
MPDIYTSEKRSEIMSRVRGRDTQPERLVRAVLRQSGIRYRLNRRDLPGRPDIVIPRLKTVVFIHGCFWHGHSCRRGQSMPKTNLAFWQPKMERNIQRDRENRDDLRNMGWRVLVVWECETKQSNILCAKLRQAIQP